MAKPSPKTKKKIKSTIVDGVAHVQASFNNTIITITDRQGNTHSRYRAVSGCWLGLARRDGRNWILDCSIPLAKPVRVTATKVAARDVAAERSRRSRPTPEAVTARVLQAAS